MSNVFNEEQLKVIRNKFFCCVPVKELGLENVVPSLSWEQQKLLINLTTNSHLVHQYPVKHSYQKLFVKSVINILEETGSDVNDVIYKSFCDIIQLCDSDIYYFKHYVVGNKLITLKENRNYISEGTTGLCIWQASLVLSQWCIINKKYLQNKTILELGSGVGLVGLTVLQCCQPRKVYLSDCHPKVLAVLCENLTYLDTIEQCDISDSTVSDNSADPCVSTVKTAFDSRDNTVKLDSNVSYVNDSFINGNTIENKTKSRALILNSVFNSDSLDSSSEKQRNSDPNSIICLETVKNNCDVCVLSLPWEQITENNYYSTILPEVILAADVVFDKGVFESLCDVLIYFFGQNPKIEAIFACTERNLDTLAEFLNILEYKNLKVTNLKNPEPEHFFWPTTSPIRLISITAA